MKIEIYLLVACSILFSCSSECEKIISRHPDGSTEIVREYPDCSDKVAYTEKLFNQEGVKVGERIMTSIIDPIMVKSWYTNGQLSAQWMEKYGKEHGHIVCWYENGQKQKEGDWEEGLEMGLHIEWHENGQKSQEGIYRDGKKDSVWTYWFENGKTEIRETYKLDTLNGPTITWYPNGNRKQELHYENGIQQGEYKKWDSTNALLEHYFVKNDTVRKIIVEKE